MEKDTTYTVNRQELIRMARESCEGNLKSSGNGRFTYGLSRKDEKEKKTNRRTNPSTNVPMNNVVKSNESILNKRQISLKLLLIRTICASVIVLTIIIVDKLKLSYETFNSDYIVENLENNRIFEKAEEFFTNLQGEKIVDVFNRLD